MKKYRVVLEEIDNHDKVIKREIVTEVDSVNIKKAITDLTEEDKQAWLNQVEQNAMNAANTLKKTLQSKKSEPKKNK